MWAVPPRLLSLTAPLRQYTNPGKFLGGKVKGDSYQTKSGSVRPVLSETRKPKFGTRNPEP